MNPRLQCLTLVCVGLSVPYWKGFAQTTSQAIEERRIPPEGKGYQLFRVAGMASSRSGDVYIAASDVQTIYQFSESGKLIRHIGRSGSGPGEFRLPSFVGLKDDSLWIFDYALARISLFTPQGELARTIPLAHSGNGFLMGDGTIAITPLVGYARDINRPSMLRVQRYTPDGRFLNDMLAQRYVVRGIRFIRNGGLIVGEQPFDDYALFALSPIGDGMVVVVREVRSGAGEKTFTITRIAAGGDTVYSKRYPYTPQRLSSALVDTKVASLMGGTPEGRPTLRSDIQAAIFRPAHLPTITAVQFGLDGSIWLRREEPADSSVRWTILSATGLYTRDISLPSIVWPYSVRGSGFWGVRYDADGVPVVVHFRLH